MIKQIIVMRKDLGMRKGKMIAQGSHASMKVFFDAGNFTENPESVKHERGISVVNHYLLTIPMSQEMYAWARGIFTKICVSVDSEDSLLAVCHKAKEANLPCALIQDQGRTEFKEPTYTCCAIGPAEAEKIDPITGELPLL